MSKHRCVMCGVIDEMEGETEEGAMYLCRPCFAKVKQAYEEKHPEAVLVPEGEEPPEIQ